MSSNEAAQAANQYLASRNLPIPGDAPAALATASPPGPASGGAPDFIKMPLQIVQQIAQGYKQYGWALKLARVKIPKEIDQALNLIAQGNMAGAEELQRMAGQAPTPQQPALSEGEPLQEPEPEVGQTVMTPRMIKKAIQLEAKGFGTRDIAQYFIDRHSPVSHATIATCIKHYYADVDEDKNFEHENRLKMFGLYGSFIGIVAVMLLIAHFVFHF